MKKIVFCALLCFSFLGKAQVGTTIINKEMSNGVQSCYELSIEDVVHKEVRKSWIKKMDGFTKEKPKLGDLDMEFYDVKISNLKFDSINVISRILQRDKSVIIQTFFETENGFVSDSGDFDKSHEYILDMMNDFGKETYNGHYLKKVGVQNKVLKKRMGELSSLNNEVVKQTKLINKRESGIRNNKADIVNVLKQIDMSKTQVLDQSTVVSQLSATASTYKSESKKLKSLQRKSDKLISKKASLEKEIHKFENQIESAKVAIEQAKLDIKSKEIEIKDENSKLSGLNKKII